MLSILSNLCANLFDQTVIPAETLPTHETTTHLASDHSVEWHNGFGTLAEFEVPASSDLSDPFASL
jgi:hypothetical protein